MFNAKTPGKFKEKITKVFGRTGKVIIDVCGSHSSENRSENRFAHGLGS